MTATKTKKAKKLQGPDLYKRNPHGLLENVDYIFNEDGSVNWRAMIKPEFLYPNKGWFDIRNKPFPDSIEGLDDKQLLIMLGGIKELARLRGFEQVTFKTETTSEGYVVAKCRITWIPNYESGSESIVYEDVANATLENTDSFASKFLETIACNRAFVRCVRNFLNIHIVGADEIDKSKSSMGSAGGETFENVSSPITTPTNLLEKTLREKHGVDSFESCKSLLRDLWKKNLYQNESAVDWQDFKDIPAKEARKLIAILSK